jgi:DNA repair exonuclease SbcCD ATPase subunit
VARFIRKSPDDRRQVLAHLAGIGFYQRCLEKALAVKAEAEKRIRRQGEGSQQRTADISSLRAELANRESRIESIRNTLEGSAPTRDDVLAAIQQLEEAVQIDLLPDTGSPGELAAAVQGICDERRRDLQELGKTLDGLAVSTEGVPGWVARQQELQSRLASSQTSLDRLVQAEREQTDRLETIEADLRRLDQDIASTAQREESLRQLIDLRSRRRGLCDRQEAIEREKGPAHDRLNALNEEREGVATRLSRLQTEVAERRHAIEQLATRLHRMQDLRTRYGEYDRARQRESDLRVRIAELTPRQPDLQLRLQRITNDSAVAEQRRDELKATVGRIAARSTELGQLLGRIKAYVTGRTCPLCGRVHASQQDLLHAIDAQIQSLPAEQQEIARQLHEADSQSQRLSADLSSLRNELSGVERDLASARNEQTSLVELTRRLDTEAYAAGVSMLPEVLDSRIRDAENELAQLETQ